MAERYSCDSEKIKHIKKEIENFEEQAEILKNFKYDIILTELPDKKYLAYDRHKIKKLIEQSEKKSEIYLKYKHNLEKLELTYKEFQEKIDVFMNFYENEMHYSFDNELIELVRNFTENTSRLNKKIATEKLINYFQEKINNLSLEDDSLRDKIYTLKISYQKYKMYENELKKYEKLNLNYKINLSEVENENKKLEEEYTEIMKRKNSDLYYKIIKYKKYDDNFITKLNENIEIAKQRKDIFFICDKVNEFNKMGNFNFSVENITELNERLSMFIEKYEDYYALKYSVAIFKSQKNLGLENEICQLCTVPIQNKNNYATAIDEKILIIEEKIKKNEYLEKFENIIGSMKKIKILLKNISTLKLPENQKSVEKLEKIKSEFQLYLENKNLVNHRSSDDIQKEIIKNRKLLSENIKNEQIKNKHIELKDRLSTYDIENINNQLNSHNKNLEHIQNNKKIIFEHFNNLKSIAKIFINLIVEIRNNDFKENSNEYNIDLLKNTLHYKKSKSLHKKFPGVHNVKEHYLKLKNNISICTKKLNKGNKNIDSITKKLFEVRGELKQIKLLMCNQKNELSTQYSSTKSDYKSITIKMKILDFMVKDILKLIIITEKTITKFMNKKIEELNFNLKRISNQLLINDFFNHIQFRVNMDKSYSFKLEMYCNGQYMDMKTHSSAGQQTIAALIFRLGLIETFVRQNTIIILDEPTANLDRVKIDRLSEALVNIFKKSNHQFILISHDKEFIERINIHTNPNIFLIKNTEKSSFAVLKH